MRRRPDERARKMRIMEERMREIELSLRNVKMLLKEKVAQLNDQAFDPSSLPLAVVFRLQPQVSAPRCCLQAAATGLRPSLLSSGCGSSPQLEVNTHEHPGAERLCVRMHVGRTAR
ncbi:hypothetical protein EYF80_036072 [Liparis tanakae]|uniref:Uncharacterized protein n=1 Tax=Liparis tanakae TaxID=230148 RepID=A0A4Z2GLS1_9TELE|nr:hypothetical protein EYF80_036072 [Liparis tanakae]